MKDKIFEFYGFTLKTLVIGAISGSLLGIAAFFGLNSIIRLNHPGFMLVITAAVCMSFLVVWGKYFRSLWKMKIEGNSVEVYRNGKLHGAFEFADMKRLQIHGFGWNYRVESNESPTPDLSALPFYIRLELQLKNFRKILKKKDQGLSRTLTIETDRQKFRINLDCGQFSYISTTKDLAAFDDFFSVLENYAIEKKYEKINMTSETMTPKRIRKYKYVRKEK